MSWLDFEIKVTAIMVK